MRIIVTATALTIISIVVLVTHCSREMEKNRTAGEDAERRLGAISDSLAATDSMPLIVDLQAIAGADRESVAVVLGDPFKVERIPEGALAAYYQPTFGKDTLLSGAGIEVDYVNGRADWITIKGQRGMFFSSSVLQSLGLPASSPSFQNEFVIAWTEIPGLKEIRAFPDHRGGIDYVWVNVFTAP